jgi:hypothetical protein
VGVRVCRGLSRRVGGQRRGGGANKNILWLITFRLQLLRFIKPDARSPHQENADTMPFGY